VKALPDPNNPDPMAKDSQAPDGAAAAPDPAADQQPTDDSRQWAGDPYDDGDEPAPDDPSVTARFATPDGEEAWLQRAQDGTLTGWLRDPSGQVYRYADADAWAVDVDDAGMTAAAGGDTATDPGTVPADQAPPVAQNGNAADTMPPGMQK